MDLSLRFAAIVQEIKVAVLWKMLFDFFSVKPVNWSPIVNPTRAFHRGGLQCKKDGGACRTFYGLKKQQWYYLRCSVLKGPQWECLWYLLWY